jgi:hypothetical protein
LSELNRKLKETAKKAQILFQDAVESLECKLEELNLSRQDLVELGSQNLDDDCRIAFLEQQIEIAKRLEMNLENGKEASTWLSRNITQFARSAGKYALEQCAEITSTASPRHIDNFYFSIEQFLERVSHCLSWGRYDILDSSDIPLVFDVHVYETAFNFVKRMLPRRLNDETKQQVEDYLNYLIQRLPYY